jgi:hypothetical protein
MPTAIIYSPTGQITRVVDTMLEEDLDIQPLGEQEQLLRVTEATVPLLQQADRYRIIDGQLASKQQVTLEADRLTFAADGLEEVAITVVGLTDTPCTVQINGTRLVTPEDGILVLTSDEPRRFVVQVPPDEVAYWAAPLTLVAT